MYLRQLKTANASSQLIDSANKAQHLWKADEDSYLISLSNAYYKEIDKIKELMNLKFTEQNRTKNQIICRMRKLLPSFF